MQWLTREARQRTKTFAGWISGCLFLGSFFKVRRRVAIVDGENRVEAVGRRRWVLSYTEGFTVQACRVF